jgi:acyl-CoA synthetase (AMP-forming)/AMP-acid ligase II
MSDAAGVPAIPSARATGFAVRVLGARRVALVTPCPASVLERLGCYYTGKYGLEVVARNSFSGSELGQDPARDAIARTGASPIAEDLLRRAMRVFANASFCQVYGSTESSTVATILDPADHDEAKGRLRSCGKAHAGTEVCVVDADGNAMPTGHVGEVVLRGHFVMKGYWRNQVATEAAFYPKPAEPEPISLV